MDGGAPAGYADALALLDRRIEREIARLRARYQLSLDEFRGLYVSDEHVDDLVAAAGAARTLDAAYPQVALAGALAPLARWQRMVETFGLVALEQDLLLLALAPELDAKYETLYAYLNNDVTRKWPTLDLARRLLEPPTGLAAIGAALAPDASLRRHGLIEPIAAPPTRPAQLNAGFALQPAPARFLLGIALTPAAAGAAVADAANRWQRLPFAPALIERLQGVARLLGAGEPAPPAIVLHGEHGSGRRRAARAIARELELPLREFDGSALRREGASPAAALRSLALEIALEPAAVCISGLEALCDREGRLAPDAHGLLHALDASVPVLLIVSGNAPWRELLGARRALRVEFVVPGFDERSALWRRALDAAGLTLDAEDCVALADRFRFWPAQIAAAIRTAQDDAVCADSERVDLPQLLAAARAQCHTHLHGLASKVDVAAGWDDLVLAPTTARDLRELSAAMRHRHVVYSEWCFAQRAGSGGGVKALFAGASGTGKTMAAGVIARELGLDLYKIDLAGVVSKYIGETEKNLDRIFAAAYGANGVLFFDEADAVFGKRSEVKDAHDRYANVETAYLLQKLEEHDGVVILASNLKRNIDDAFARRLHYVIDFAGPDAVQRERLWRGMFPAAAPLEADVDFAFLARQFELAGGAIRNVALDAAFLAASERARIGMRHLARALTRQLSKQGKAPSRVDFERYFDLIEPAGANGDDCGDGSESRRG